MYDTCVLVSAVRSANGAARVMLEFALEGKVVTPVLSVPLLLEYADVLSRPNVCEIGWTNDATDELLDSLLASGHRIASHFSYRPTLADENDEFVLEAAINGQANILTHNVKHFRPAKRFGVEVFRPVEALAIVKRRTQHGTK